MTLSQRTLSLSLLGAMALTLAPLASAQGFGMNSGARGRGHMGFGDADIDADTRAEIRAELKACHDEHEGDHDAMKACADAVFEEYGIERPERPEPEDRPEIPEEARDELEECREEHEGDFEAMKECADAVFEEYNLRGPGHGVKMGHRFRSAIVEACGEREDSEEWRSCAQDQRSSVREDHPRAHGRRGGLFGSSDLRAELRACLELDNQEALRECVFGNQ